MLLSDAVGAVRAVRLLLLLDVGLGCCQVTALYKAGASHLDIMTMGRWSSDCYRLYVRACFGGAVRWSRLAGSTPVDDVAAISEYREVDCF